MSTFNIEHSPDQDIAGSYGAIKRAALSASALARAQGSRLAVWRDGRVVLLTPDEFEGKASIIREPSAKYGDDPG